MGYMNNIVNHKQGQRHRAGTLVRWVNNTIAEVQNDGRHIIVANLNKKQKKRSPSRQMGGRRCNQRQNNQNRQRSPRRQNRQRSPRRQNRQRGGNKQNEKKKRQEQW